MHNQILEIKKVVITLIHGFLTYKTLETEISIPISLLSRRVARNVGIIENHDVEKPQ